MQNERNVTIAVEKTPAFTETWYEGYVELDGEKPATTLFFMGPQQREWGFLVETKKGVNRWIKNDHYLTDWKNYHEKYIAPKAAHRKVR